MAKILASGLCALALLVPQLVARAADVFWMPIHDGQRLAFLQSGTIVNSDGSGSTWGPEAAELQIQAVDRSLLGQHADWRLLNGDTRFTGTYLAQTAAGLFRISEGDPAVDAVYRYYTDPQPWLYLTAPLDPGASLGFAGLRRGQWTVPGDGIVDRWQRESQTILAVPEPAAAWSLAAGLAVLALLLRRRRRAV